MDLRNSTFTEKTFSDLIHQLLSNAENKKKNLKLKEPYHITGLSFKYCFLKGVMIKQLAKILESNRTLVKLDLSCNGLSSIMGNELIKSLIKNDTLAFLDLSYNCLGDEFAFPLAKLLEENRVLYEVTISNNQVIYLTILMFADFS